MVSINNTAANSFVLASLRQTNSDITTSQTRIGTGFKINGASDGASAWATAQSIRSDLKTQSSLTSSISVAKAKADAAVAGLDQITTLVGKIKDLADNAGTLVATEKASTGLVSQLKALVTQMGASIAASGFQTSNYLGGTAVSGLEVQIGSDADATISIDTVKIDTVGTSYELLTDAINDLVSGTSLNSAVSSLSNLANNAVSYLSGYQATLAGFSSGLESQMDFMTKLDTIKNSALSAIVDTDMEAESARVTALQVKQQLAYQALAITNSSSQNILRLFQ
jgi:flagellin